MARIPTGAEDYFRNLEKRLSRLERRPVPMEASDLLGPGITSRAVQIMDWDSSDAIYNGFFHTEVGGINTPDPMLSWTGQVIAKDDGTGMQQVWNTDGPETLYWMRTYAPDPDDLSLVVFSPWKKFATTSGYIGMPELDDTVVDAINNPVVTDGVAPAEATVLTPISGIKAMHFRWTQVPNTDAVTYRLHVRGNADPTTDGTYEVASGTGLTFASVPSLTPGVIYHAIVTVEDADGRGPDSNVATGTPTLVTDTDVSDLALTFRKFNTSTHMLY